MWERSPGNCEIWGTEKKSMTVNSNQPNILDFCQNDSVSGWKTKFTFFKTLASEQSLRRFRRSSSNTFFSVFFFKSFWELACYWSQIQCWASFFQFLFLFLSGRIKRLNFCWIITCVYIYRVPVWIPASALLHCARGCGVVAGRHQCK